MFAQRVQTDQSRKTNMTTLADNNTVQSEFPSDQAAILRDLARDGAPNEPSTYGYGNVASSGQSNGTKQRRFYIL